LNVHIAHPQQRTAFQTYLFLILLRIRRHPVSNFCYFIIAHRMRWIFIDFLETEVLLLFASRLADKYEIAFDVQITVFSLRCCRIVDLSALGFSCFPYR